MDQDPRQVVTHKLDTRVAVVEALQIERNKKSSEEHAAIMAELARTRETVTNLRIKTAGFSGVIALAASFLVHWFTK